MLVRVSRISRKYRERFQSYEVVLVTFFNPVSPDKKTLEQTSLFELANQQFTRKEAAY